MSLSFGYGGAAGIMVAEGMEGTNVKTGVIPMGT